MAYIKKIWKDYPDTTTPILASDMNNIEDGLEAVDTVVNGGWAPLTGTFTYSSADSPTFVMSTSVNLTGIVGLGMRIKLTQATTKYFIVTAITSNSITMYGGTDYTLVSASISNVYYSIQKAPFGFPMDIDKWTVTLNDTTQRSQVTTDATIYNMGSISISIPIGKWEVNYQLTAQVGSTTSGSKYATLGLSTANNTLIAAYAVTLGNGDVKFIRQFCNRTFNYTAAAKTSLYLNMQDAIGGNTIYIIYSASSPITITAKCMYI